MRTVGFFSIIMYPHAVFKAQQLFNVFRIAHTMFKSLQIGRAIAALLVVFHHATLDSSFFYGTAFNDFWIFGNIGVDFFFVLSGFIIYWAHKKDQEGVFAAKVYAYKRLVRIYAPFILISVVMFSAYYFVPALSQSDRTIGFISSFFLIPQEHTSPALSVSWTLMHELLFYAVFIVSYIRKRLLLAFSLVWSILILLYPLIQQKYFLADFLLDMHNIQFLLGMVLAYFFYNHEQVISNITKNKLLPSIMLALSITSLSYILFNKAILSSFLNEYYVLVVGVGFFILIMSMLLAEGALMWVKLFNSKSLLFLGAASYSIYLFHNPALSILNRFAAKVISIYPALNSELIFISISALATLGGIFYYLLWEKPILSQMRKKVYPYFMEKIQPKENVKASISSSKT